MTVRAVQIASFGGPEVLRLVDAPTADPGPDDVRIRIAAAGLNFIDTYKRSGAYTVSLPAILGEEAAGTVDAVGSAVAGVQPGDRVAFTDVQGAYAEFAVVPAHRVVAVPNDIELETAAAVLLQGLTAHYLTHSTFPLTAAHTAVVTAAAGGVGQLVVQLAKRLGAHVIGIVSTDEKAKIAQQHGADEVVRLTESLADDIRGLTGGRGVDVVFDSVGLSTFRHSLAVLRPRGMLVLFGQASGPVPPIDVQDLNRFGSLYLTRPSLTHYIQTPEELTSRARQVFDWVAAGMLRLRIDRRFELRQAVDAHRYIEARRTMGKVLLIP